MNVRRGLTAVAFAVAVAPALLGCGTGFDSGITKVKPDTPMAQRGPLRVLNPVLVVATDQADTAVLHLAIVNDGPADVLEDITVEGARAALPDGRISLPGQGVVLVGAKTATQGAVRTPAITVHRVGGKPAAGDFATLLLSFRSAGLLPVDVQVNTPTGPYASLAPTPPPAGSPSAPARPEVSTGTTSTGFPNPTG